VIPNFAHSTGRSLGGNDWAGPQLIPSLGAPVLTLFQKMMITPLRRGFFLRPMRLASRAL
jgi:hypothetical protein